MKGTFVTVLRYAGVLTLATFGATGCGGGDPEGGDATVEVFSWWASPSETRALQALIDVHKRAHPEVEVINNSAGVERAVLEQRLDERMAEGLPPDVFQVHGGVRLMDWVKYNGLEGENKLEPLDDIAASSRWLSTVPASVVETVTHRGHVYAVPVNVHRVNCLFYNKRLFAENELTPPTTLDELYAVNEAFAAKGITPLALAAKDPGTPAGLMWEHIFVMSAGAQYYDDMFQGRLKSPDTPQVRAALEAGLEVLKYVDADAAEELLWVDGVELVGQGKAAMYMDGDWVKAEFQARGYALDEDFGMVTVGDDAFVYVVDTFVLPRGALHRGAALDLLATMGSVEGQDALNPLKGSIPSRTDTDLGSYDSLSRKAMEDARSPETRFVPARNLSVPRPFFDPIDRAFWEFVKDRNTDKMILAMEAHYYIIQDHYDQL
ncbi:ABC transporter substrate-binding protein [Sorangium sp. So ce233]|uniref:ABC transporter substrate-binding protein n=1 Tax=Sorangium sp. So ce233 TaxID=3133290 RepID=UPI003F6346FE